jgi:alkylation response protein AidB-like acyl-CoA dehydrogenase
MIYLMHTGATQVIVAARSFPLRPEILKSIVSGRHLSTLAFSEKGSRSHFWAPVSQPAAEDIGQVLSADKSFVTSAGHADSYIVSTRSQRPVELTDSTLYYVPAAARGLQVAGSWSGLGLRGNASAPLRLRARAAGHLAAPVRRPRRLLVDDRSRTALVSTWERGGFDRNCPSRDRIDSAPLIGFQI